MLTSSKRPIVLATLSALLVIGVAFAGSQPSTSTAQAKEGTEGLPPGARIETVLTGMEDPVAIAFDPSGRLFYTEKSTGRVRLFANGALQPNPVITYNVSTCSERGLLGIAIDPNFNANRYIYVYYTVGPGCGVTENKVARFVERDGVGSNSVDIFASPQTAGNHDGGNIHFGPDGKLYITVGDSANAATAQNLASKNGKIHRINSDGTNPADNPNFNQPGALGSIYALGLRNSFDFAFDPVVRGRIFASENGPGCDDEMNRIERGYNYGWRSTGICEGGNPDPRVNNIAPLWFLDNERCCEAPTGITVYTGHQIPQWRNHLFMAAYTGGKLRHFYLNNDRTAVITTNVVQGITANMDLETGPDGAFWYIEGGGYSTGTLKRVVGPGTPVQTPTVGTPPTPGAVPTISVPGTNSRLFPETSKTVRGLFLDYWEKNGGLAQQGFPISDVLGEVSELDGKPYTVQYFERAVFEYHPENQPPFNVLLSQLGTFQYKQKYPNGAPNQKPNNDAGSTLFPQTGKRVGGRFLEYWRQNGGLAQQGYPLSEEFTEVSPLNGRSYTVQYFERAVFEYHPGNQRPFDVLLSLLGRFRLTDKYDPGSGSVDDARLLSTSVIGGATLAGRYLLWIDIRSGTPSIYGYDLNRNREFLVSDDLSDKIQLVSDGQTVAWIEGNFIIRGYRIDSGQLYTVLDAAGGHLAGLAVESNFLYYQEGSGRGHVGLYMRDLTTGHERQVSAKGRDPVATDGRLLWKEERQECFMCGTDWKLRLLDTTKASMLPSSDSSESLETLVSDLTPWGGPFSGYDVSGNNIVWARYSHPAYLHNIPTNTSRPIPGGDALKPFIQGNAVVWTVGPTGMGYGPKGFSIQIYDVTLDVMRTLIAESNIRTEAWGIVTSGGVPMQEMLVYTQDPVDATAEQNLYIKPLPRSGG